MYGAPEAAVSGLACECARASLSGGREDGRAPRVSDRPDAPGAAEAGEGAAVAVRAQTARVELACMIRLVVEARYQSKSLYLYGSGKPWLRRSREIANKQPGQGAAVTPPPPDNR
ncbi:jg17734 [Pararge aegeria aegeria]|uniref:Jg17734 protein n=1 Tax=Pararge aegeria aegeria TaxID=348720 RepID=A0A8S4S979_9NEOP|nr:jg17734 [Pararge aegeria aegeria]